MIRTINDLLLLIRDTTKRGLVLETSLPGSIKVFVPIWDVKRMRVALEDHTPVGIQFDVKPLTFIQHFTVWKAGNATTPKKTPPERRR